MSALDSVRLHRLSLPRDSSLLIALHRMVDEGNGFSRDPEEYDRFVAYLQEHGDIYHCLALVAGEEPVGYVRCYERISTSSCDLVFMLDIVEVAPAWRGRGLGKKLVAAVIALAGERNAARIDLLADVNNEVAIGLYRSFGFKGRQRFQMHRFLKERPDLDAYFEAKKKAEEEAG